MTGDWYWDLKTSRVIPGHLRGRDAHTLGPYPTHEAALNWKQTNETRDEAWEIADKRWADTWDDESDEW